MRHSIFALALGLAASLPGLVLADELVVATDSTEASDVAALPKKGLSSSAVRKSFGDPQKKYAAVGGESPRHPPITRWDYAVFSVFFENDHVVDAVVPGHPAQIYHTESLQPVSAASD